MAQRKTLNEKQIGVLRWIAAGCTHDDGDEMSRRISAAALRNRGLVKTSGRGPTWAAKITASGKEYLAQVESPDPPRPRQPNVSVTQQLVDDVVAAGGSLRVPRKHWQDPGAVDYERRARLAEAHGKLPPGSRFVVSPASQNEILIELRTDLHGGEGEPGASALGPVPVPARLIKYHRVAQEFRDKTGVHEVSRKAVPRTLRVVHALATEAERRGYTASCVQVREDSYGRSEWKPSKDGQLVFTINEHELKVRIWEKGAGQRGPYERELRRWTLDRGQPVSLMRFLPRPKAYDSAATGELNAEALGYSNGRQSSWGDRSRWTLEDRLPHLLRELETQAAEAEERRLARQREEEERHRQWEAAMERAKRLLIEGHRRDVLRSRVEAWREADSILAYCDAVETLHGTDNISADPGAAQWLELAREHANRAQRLPQMPPYPEVTAESLRPYLDGWSPYGPQRR